MDGRVHAELGNGHEIRGPHSEVVTNLTGTEQTVIIKTFKEEPVHVKHREHVEVSKASNRPEYHEAALQRRGQATPLREGGD